MSWDESSFTFPPTTTKSPGFLINARFPTPILIHTQKIWIRKDERKWQKLEKTKVYMLVWGGFCSFWGRLDMYKREMETTENRLRPYRDQKDPNTSIASTTAQKLAHSRKQLYNCSYWAYLPNRDVLLQRSLWRFVVLLTVIFGIWLMLEHTHTHGWISCVVVLVNIVRFWKWFLMCFWLLPRRSWVKIIPNTRPVGELQEIPPIRRDFSQILTFSGGGFPLEKGLPRSEIITNYLEF